MTAFLEAERAALMDAARAEVGDPVQLFGKLKELKKLVARDIQLAQAEVARRLYEDRTWDEVGEALGGVTGTRAEQISRAAR